jgi:integrase
VPKTENQSTVKKNQKKHTKVDKYIYCTKRGNSYRYTVTFRRDGQVFIDTATYKSKEDGAKWAKTRRVELWIEADQRRPSVPVKEQPVEHPDKASMREIFRVYRQEKLPTLSGESVDSSRLNKLDSWFGALKLGQLNYQCLDSWKKARLCGEYGFGRQVRNQGKTGQLTKHQKRYRKQKGESVPVATYSLVSSQTVRHELVLLRRTVQFYFIYMGWKSSYGEWLAGQYLMNINLPTKAKARVQRLSDEAINKILAKMPTKEAQVAIRLAIGTTLRRSEILSLRWEDIQRGKDGANAVIKLRSPGEDKKTKTHEREVPLFKHILQVLDQLIVKKQEGKIFTYSASGLSQAWRRAADAAGYPQVRLHDCRREGISRLVDANFPIDHVIEFSGHSDIRTLREHYVKPDASRLASVEASTKILGGISGAI